VTRDELLEQSDIVSLHCPNTPETKGMVNQEFLARMKPDGVLLNTSRGSVINDEALLAKLEECPAFWYGTDVFNGEPSTGKAEWTCPLSTHARVYGTHHCGASTAQAESAIGSEALRVIKKFAVSGEVDEANTVNKQKSSGDLAKVVVRYRTKINVLKTVFEMLAMMQMNVIDV
jgi:D-3-phosphoglycerate dehydrogenase